MLGEIRCGSLSEPSGALMRDVLMRDILGQAVSASATGGSSFKQHFERIWRSTIDVWFTVEPQPLAHQRVSIDRIEPNGQAIPKIELGYPSYFGRCVDVVLDYAKRHEGDRVAHRQHGDRVPLDGRNPHVRIAI